MKDTWVLSIKTSLPNTCYTVELYIDLKKAKKYED